MAAAATRDFCADEWVEKTDSMADAFPDSNADSMSPSALDAVVDMDLAVPDAVVPVEDAALLELDLEQPPRSKVAATTVIARRFMVIFLQKNM